MRTAQTLRSSALSSVQRVTEDGQAFVEERLSDAVPTRYGDLLVEWAREVARWQKGHQPVLAVDTTQRTVRFAAEGPLVSGSQLAAAFSALDRPFPIELWLSLAQSWGRAVQAQLVSYPIAGVRGQWVVDADQLAVTRHGHVLFGHARTYSVMDGLRLQSRSESDPLPLVRHPLQLGTDPKDLGPAAQVKDLAFSLVVLLTGRMPFDGVDDAERVLAVGGPLGVEALSPALEGVLHRAMHVRREERFPDVPAFLAALASAAQVEPMAPARTMEVLRAAVAEGETADRRDRLDVACGRRPPPVVLTEEQRVDRRAVDWIVERLRTGMPLEAVGAADEFAFELSRRRYRKATLERWMTEACRRCEAELAAGAGRETEALERAFAALNAAGIVARLGYGWSTKSGLELFAYERAALQGAGRVRGLVFCSMQTESEAAADADLWLATCHLDDGSSRDEGQQAQAFLEEVQAALQAEGLRVTALDRRPDQRVCDLRLEGFRLFRRTDHAECVGGDPRFGPAETQRALSTPEGIASLTRRASKKAARRRG